MAAPAAADIPALVRRLRSPASRARAAGALSDLCKDDSRACAGVLAAGGVAALIDCLRSGDEAAQPPAAGALGDLALVGPAACTAIVEAGALPALVSCLASNSPAVQYKAGFALVVLAEGSLERCAACAEAGAVAPLARMLESSDALVCGIAAHALCKLSAAGSLAVQQAIAQATPMPTLLRLLQHGDEVVLLGALAVLANLAPLSDAQRAASVPAVPALLRLLGMPCSAAEPASSAVAALCNLALSDDVARTIVVAGGVPKLVSCMRQAARAAPQPGPPAHCLAWLV